MKVQKIDDVRFTMSDGEGGEISRERSGELHIARDGIVIREGETIYKMSFSSLHSVEVVSGEPLRLRMRSDGFQLEIQGGRAERIWALRALILPIINGGDRPRPGTKTLLILVGAGVREVPQLARIMALDEEEIGAMIDDIRGRGMITEDLDLTDNGLEMFSESEREFLSKLGVKGVSA